MNFRNLTDENIDLYTMKYYDNPQCISVEDYQADMKRFKYIKRILNQYGHTDQMKLRLLLNHIIMLYNVFDNSAATRIIFYKIDSEYWSILKSVLKFLDFLPTIVKGIKGSDIIVEDIPVNTHIEEMLQQI